MEGSEKFSDQLNEDQVNQFVAEMEAAGDPMTEEEREQWRQNIRGFFGAAHMLALRVEHEAGGIDMTEVLRQQEIAMINLGESPERVEAFHEHAKLQDSFMRQWRDEEAVVSSSGLSLFRPAVNRLPVDPADSGYLVITGEQIEAMTTAADRRHTEVLLSALEHAAILLDRDLSLKKIRELARIPLIPDGEEAPEESPEDISKRTGWHCLFRSRFFEQTGRPDHALKLQRQAFGELSKANDFVGAGYVRYREIATLKESGQLEQAEQKVTSLVSFVAKHAAELGDRAASALLWMVHERTAYLLGDDAFQRLIRTIEKYDLRILMESNNLRSEVPDVPPQFPKR